MSAHWPVVKLAEVADIFDGPHATPRKTDVGPVFLGISNLEGGRLNLAVTERLSEDDYARWVRRVEPQEGDLVFSYETRIGAAALIPKGLRCCLGRRLGLLRAKPDRLDPRFLLYAFLAPEFQETLRERTNHGSTVERISLNEMPDFPLRVPPLRLQRRIGCALAAIDEQFGLIQHMNETLEAMARALFKSWFVDFDPVRALAEGRRPVGMDAETATLFPAAFDTGPNGAVPRGWRQVKLGDVLELKRGYDLPAAQRRLGGVPIISSSGPTGTHDHAMAQAPGVVTGRYGTIGKVFFVHEPFWPLNTTLYVRDFKGQEPLYAYYLLQSLDFAKFSDKAAVPGINRNDVHEEPVLLPPVAIQRKFSAVAESLLARVSMNDAQAEHLSAIRDLLLPKLLSGELDIEAAVSCAEEPI